MSRKLSTLAFWTAIAVAPPALAQDRSKMVGGELDEYLRLLELEGKAGGMPLVFGSFSSGRYMTADSNHLWGARYRLEGQQTRPTTVTVSHIFPTIEFLYNSAYPRSANDGALWSGKGLSGTLTGGASATWGPVTATFYPTVYFSQNRDFVLAPITFNDRTEFAYPWSANIDWPQRFGSDAIKEFDLGQSGIRIDLGGFTAALSTENMLWGPAFRNPIIMGNSAPGFPHVDLGTGHPVSIGIGDLEVRAVWGELRESDYFDTNSGNDRRYITGLTLGFKPDFLPGLTIGGTRILYQKWPDGGLGAGEIFDVLGEFFREATIDAVGSVVNDSTDQTISLVVRWVLPRSGFEAYVEWARGDFSGNLRDFVIEPDHSRTYTFGFAKALPSGDGVLRLRGESTTLGRSSTFLIRGSPSYYTHSIVTAGYTHRGQILGAAIGPGGQSQYLGIDRYTNTGRWGVFIQRVRFNDDYYFANFTDRGVHDVELTLGASVLRFVRNFDLGATIELSRRLNWKFQRRNDVTNVKLGLRLGWRGD